MNNLEKHYRPENMSDRIALAFTTDTFLQMVYKRKDFVVMVFV